jgi:hypothetical protein
MYNVQELRVYERQNMSYGTDSLSKDCAPRS